MDFGSFRDAVEKTWFLLALGDVVGSRKKCMEAVTLLNSLKDKNQDHIYRQLSQYVLQLYDTIGTKDTQKRIKSGTIITWLNSKLSDRFYYPEITFSDDSGACLRSGDGLFVSGEAQSPLPLPQLDVSYQQIHIDRWTVDPDHLSNLHQDLLANCSFVSSFLSLSSSSLVDSVFNSISPHCASSTYTVVLTFNGCRRTVTIDNRLPVVNAEHRYLTIRSSSDSQLYWPALVEKAYLKVMGKGYTIDGSNMAYDTYMLTGWIPEIVQIKDGRIPQHLRDMMRNHFPANLTVGMGTGKISKTLSEKVGLISHHDYTMLGFNKEKKIVTLKNPWLESVDKNRVIDISYTDLFQFSYVYLNWNAEALFKYKSTETFLSTGGAGTVSDTGTAPQFGIKSPSTTAQEVWLFLERFFVQDEATGAGVNIAVDIYNTDTGDKVLFPKQYSNVCAGEPTNARTVLVRFTMEPNRSYTVVSHSTCKCSMSLTLYNNFSDSLKLVRARVKYPQLLSIDDEWDFTSSGGSSSLSSYITNPQFNLVVKDRRTSVFVSLEAPQCVGFDIFYWNQQDALKGIRQYVKEDALVGENGSGDGYASHIQTGSFTLEPGYYRIVCSTRDTKKRDKFQLKVHHDGNVQLEKVNASLGLFRQSVRREWNGSNRIKINVSVKQYKCNFCFHIKHSNTQFTSPSQATDYRPRLRGSLFNAETQKPVLLNEQWQSSLYGEFVDCVVSGPGNFILLVERFEPGMGMVEVEIGCNNSFEVA